MSSAYGRRLGRCSATALVSLLLGGCGSNPAGPSQVQTPQLPAPPIVLQVLPTELEPGPYRLTVLAGQDGDGCTGSGSRLSFPGGLVMVDVALARDGDNWTVRAATPADGDLELRYVPAATVGGFGAGTVTGAGHDFVARTTPVAGPMLVTFRAATGDGPAATDVRVVPTIRTAVGTIGGLIAFDTAGGRVTCNVARWILAPPTI